MGSKESKKDKYALRKVLLNTSLVVSEHYECFDITSFSYYIDDIFYYIVKSMDPDTEVWISMVPSRN